MTTDIAINGTIASVLPGDVHRVNETTSSVLPDHLYINIIEVTANSIKMAW
jgi:hypothetical protein